MVLMKFTRKFPKILKVTSVLSDPTKHHKIILHGNKSLSLFEDYLLSLLMEFLNFKVEVLEPVDKEFGRVTEEGNWTGVVGLLQRQEADIGVEVAIKEERSFVIDFTYPYQYIPMTFITDKPSYSSSIYAVLQPFSLHAWYAILISLAIVSLASYCFKHRLHSSQNLVLTMFGLLLEQSRKLKCTKLSNKLLINFWIVGVMFITFSYKAVLLSFLTFPTLTGVKDISQLSKASQSSSFRCSTFRGSVPYELLKISDYETWNNIAECMDRSNMFTKNIENFLRTTSYKKAFVGPRFSLEPLRRVYFLAEEDFFTLPVSIGIGKTFCCKNVLDEVIHKLTATGILDKIYRDTVFFQTPKENNPNANEAGVNNIKLSLHNVSGAFLILIFGDILACIVFMMEIYLGRKSIVSF